MEAHASITDAIRSVEALAALPVEEHVAVLEAAHAALRAALAGEPHPGAATTTA